MEEQEKPTDKLISTSRKVFETYKELVSLTVVENVSLAASVSVVGIVSLMFICFVLLFMALGVAWWIGESMDNMKAGFFIAGSGFLLLLLIVLIGAKSLIPTIRNLVIKKIYEEDK